MSYTVLVGDCRKTLKALPDGAVQCCVTSPPYYGLRDYGHDDQIGLEQTPNDYVAGMVAVFREVWRVLRDDGTLWLNLGDSYSGYKGANYGKTTGNLQARTPTAGDSRLDPATPQTSGLANKQLRGIPWRVAFALQADGWYLRQDIIWCISGGAWVYAKTQKGDMPVMVKDLVRLDPATVKLWNGEKWTQALGWGRNEHPEDKKEIVLRTGERIGCTGNHVWPTQRGNVRADELLVGDVIDTCTLADSDIAAPGYFTIDVAWLIGLYLAEGSRSGSAIQLSLHKKERALIKRITAAASQIGATVTHTITGNNLAVRVYGRVAHAILDQYVKGSSAHSKHLGEAAWSLPNRFLHPLVAGYLEGDGHNDKKNDRWRLGFCRNYMLERDLRILAARLGATITLHPSTARYQNGTKPAFRGEWRWFQSAHHNCKNRGEVMEIRASRARQFWDIGVEDEPHVFALASGVMTHNSKPNPMPESVRDRCTKAHEYIFLLSKKRKYYYDHEAIKEPAVTAPRKRGKANSESTVDTKQRGTNGNCGTAGARNRRSVWTVTTKSYKGAHFATFPPDLIEPCILAGCPPDGVVLDPFGGSGTVAGVAEKHGRHSILCELNQEYAGLVDARVRSITK